MQHLHHKKVNCLLIFVLFATMGYSALWAMGERGIAPEVKNEEAFQERSVDNKICPVCNGEITEEMKTQCKHKDTTCFVCSPECAEEFTKDPELYLEKLEAIEEQMTEIEDEKSEEILDMQHQ